MIRVIRKVCVYVYIAVLPVLFDVDTGHYYYFLVSRDILFTVWFYSGVDCCFQYKICVSKQFSFEISSETVVFKTFVDIIIFYVNMY